MEGAEVSNDAVSIQSREVEMEAKQTAVESALEDCTDSVIPKAAQPGGEQECVKIAENGETVQDNDNPPEIATENIDAVDEQVLTKTAEVAKSVPSATAPDDETKSSATISQQHQQAAEVSEEEIIKEECVESVSKDDEETKGESSKDDETASAIKDDFDHTSEVKQVLTTVTDLPSTVPVDAEQQKQDNLSVTLKEIISDIDREIERQEDAIRSQQPEQTADKRPTCDQQTMTQPITNESVSQGETLLQGESTFDQKLPASQPQQQSLPSQTSQTVSKSTSFTEQHDESSYMCRKESYEVQESLNVSKKIDLQKIFTPATDAEEIVPKNRKLYASSAFYSPTLHPTVEDQVELARRISHSLSDVNNQQSKGQSMYVNRKKRSVKWVHEGSGQAKLDCSSNEYEYGEESKENTDYNNVGPQTTTSTGLSKVPLKLVMNPRGQIRDFNSVGDTLNIETGLMSPNKCAELVSALNAQKGKGAELFAKRRRKAEKWVVDETNASTQNPSGLPDYHHYQPKPATSPNCLPAYSDAGKHRVQLNMQQEQLLEKYSKPGVKSLKTPWEAALETGSASTAFEDNDSPSLYVGPRTAVVSTPLQYYDNRGQSPFTGVNETVKDGYMPQQQLQQSTVQQYKTSNSSAYNHQRDLAYRPSIPQGWKAPTLTLPRGLYVPKEIPLESYAPPPVVFSSVPGQTGPSVLGKSRFPTQSSQTSAGLMPSLPQQYPDSRSSGFDQGKQKAEEHSDYPQSRFSQRDNGYSLSNTPKQPHLPPNSYQTVPQETGYVPQVNFNPSPLPYDKLAKFENPSPSPRGIPNVCRPVVMPGAYQRTRNASPDSFSANTSPCFASRQPNCSKVPGLSTSPRLSTIDLSRCQNFNNAARGWGTGNGCRNNMPVGVTGSLPYTDF